MKRPGRVALSCAETVVRATARCFERGDSAENLQCAERACRTRGAHIPKSSEDWRVSATPRTLEAKAWLLTAGVFGIIRITFLESHGDRDHRLDLIEMEFGLGFHVLDYPYIVVYVGSEQHAADTARELSRAVETAGGNLLEFAVEYYKQEFFP